MLKYFFISYIVISFLFIFYIYFFKDKKKQSFFKKLEFFYGNELTEENLEIIRKVEEIHKINTPWFEKLVSTLGVMTFITMSAATAIQTYEIYKKERSLEDLENKYNNINTHEAKINNYLNVATKKILDDYSKNGVLDKQEKEVLRIRLNKENNTSISEKEMLELFNISIALADYSASNRLFNENKEVITNKANIYDRLSLAEYFYHEGNMVGVENIVNNINSNLINDKLALRYYSLLYEVNNKDIKYISLLSSKLGKSEAESKDRIQHYLINARNLNGF